MIGHLVKRARDAQRHEALNKLDDFFAAQLVRLRGEKLDDDIAIDISYPREDFVLVEHRR